jgi:hypothetical protein
MDDAIDDAIDDGGESIDSLIQWLRSRRTAAPDAPLSELLSDRTLAPSRLVDLACIDLIERRRMGHVVAIEHYLQAFPSLRRESTRLDLIDAELCVNRELGGHSDVEDLIGRFPDLALPIRELLALDVVAEPSRPLEVCGSSGRESFDIDAAIDAASPPLSVSPSSESTQESASSPFPVSIPEWFVAAKPIAHVPGQWLIQGRDSKRRIALAMKVIELPQHITRSQCDQALNACEAAARVQNRNWITPIVAAIAGRRLAVIRPWVFANPWPNSQSSRSTPAVIHRHLSAIAFALQAAHEVGATHGAVHAENLLIDHDGRIQIVDAVCSGKGFLRWLDGRGQHESAPSPGQRRIALDTQCLIKLVAEQHCESANGSRPPDDLAELRRIAAENPSEACGRIGDHLLRR